jgi:glutamate-1-semialdehyde 2,1-aminomutase
MYEQLEHMAGLLEDGMRANHQKLGVSFAMNRVGSMMSLFFTGKPVTDFDSALTSDTGLFARYYSEMLSRGVYLAPSQFEAGFVSAAHTEQDIEQTLKAHFDSLSGLV